MEFAINQQIMDLRQIQFDEYNSHVTNLFMVYKIVAHKYSYANLVMRCVCLKEARNFNEKKCILAHDLLTLPIREDRFYGITCSKRKYLHLRSKYSKREKYLRFFLKFVFYADLFM